MKKIWYYTTENLSIAGSPSIIHMYKRGTTVPFASYEEAEEAARSAMKSSTTSPWRFWKITVCEETILMDWNLHP